MEKPTTENETKQPVLGGCDASACSEYYVEIIKYEDDEVVERMGPMSERRAEKVDRGANMNLNHDEYYTLIQNG